MQASLAVWLIEQTTRILALMVDDMLVKRTGKPFLTYFLGSSFLDYWYGAKEVDPEEGAAYPVRFGHQNRTESALGA